MCLQVRCHVREFTGKTCVNIKVEQQSDFTPQCCFSTEILLKSYSRSQRGVTRVSFIKSVLIISDAFLFVDL